MGKDKKSKSKKKKTPRIKKAGLLKKFDMNRFCINKAFTAADKILAKISEQQELILEGKRKEDVELKANAATENYVTELQEPMVISINL